MIMALLPLSMMAQETESPDISFKSAAKSLKFYVAAPKETPETAFKVDFGDGELTEYKFSNGESVEISVTRTDASQPVKVYGVAEYLDYFSIDAYNMSELTFNNCSNLSYLLCAHNDLTALDLTQFPDLLYVDCSYNNISTLDITKCPKLQRLEAKMNSNLGNINFSNCPDLERIDVGYGTKINNVNVTMLAKLKYLGIGGTNINSIDVSKNPELLYLCCDYIPYLYKLDVSKNTKLEQLYVSTRTSGYSRMQSLDVTNNPELRMLFCSGQLFTTLDVSKNTKLTSLFCSNNELNEIDTSNCPDIIEMSIFSNHIGFNQMPVPNDNPQITLYYYDPMKDLMLNDIEYAEGSDLNLSAQTYMEKYATTYKMYLTDSMNPRDPGKQLTEGIDFSVEKGVVKLLKAQSDSVYVSMTNAGFPGLTLNTSKFKVLKADEMGGNHLEFEYSTSKAVDSNAKISLSAFTPKSKIYIDWGDGELKEYTIETYINRYGGGQSGVIKGDKIKVYASKGVQIKEIQLISGEVTGIDLTNAHALRTLNLSNNALTEIDFEGNHSLETVNVSGNSLTNLEFTHHNLLISLNASKNELASLNLGTSLGLKNLNISNNKLKELDLGRCEMLETFEANSNLLESLNVVGCKALTDLRVRDNYLKELNLLTNTNLNIVWIEDNLFKFSTMPQTTSKTFSYSSQKKTPIPTKSFMVDLSSEYKIGDNITTYSWKTSSGTRLFEDEDYTIENGVTTFLNTEDYDAVYCEMKNDTWPRLTLKTTNVQPAGMPDNVLTTLESKENAGTTVRLVLATTDDAFAFIDFGDKNYMPAELGSDYTTYRGKLGESRQVRILNYKDSPVNLKTFSLSGIALKSIDLSQMPDLMCLNLSDAALKEVDITKNLNLEELTLSQNRLSELDLSKHEKLRLLNLMGSGLKSIDLTHNPNLTWLNIAGMGLESVDLSAQSKLTWLNVKENKLRNIDLSNMTLLREFYASDNLLESINLDNQPDMAYVTLNRNRFKFSTFPYHNINNLVYGDQADVEVSQNNGVVDLSSENIVNKVATVYRWLTASGTELVEGTDYELKDGVTTFLKTPEEDVVCEMTNGFFPNLVIKTVAMHVDAHASIDNISFNADATVNVYDLSGRLVASFKGSDDAMSRLNSGVYVVETISADRRAVSKVAIP